ncbi:hypothetical protein BHM03_00053969 [Ensete ventricosum]|nr:hypothetical protein BHM03_00053969 [Ensete ventricosum]
MLIPPPRPVGPHNEVQAVSTRGTPRWQSEVGVCGCFGFDFDVGLSNLAWLFLQDKTIKSGLIRRVNAHESLLLRALGMPLLYLYIIDRSSLDLIILLAFSANLFNVISNADGYLCYRLRCFCSIVLLLYDSLKLL